MKFKIVSNESSIPKERKVKFQKAKKKNGNSSNKKTQ